jgi:hypothetical protein
MSDFGHLDQWVGMNSPEHLSSPLLAEPTYAQRRLLEIVYGAYCRYGFWPIYQYVEALLYSELGLAAGSVILQCPTVRFPTSPARYGWFWSSEGRFEAAHPGAKVGLTVSGMSRLTNAHTQVQLFLAVLRYMVERERAFIPTPDVVQSVEVRSSELARDLPKWRWLLTPAALDRIAELIGNEPSTWHSFPAQPRPGIWTMTLTPLLRAFTDVASPEDYVERLTAWISPPLRLEPVGVVSSLGLPEAIDYLNAVWRLHAGKALLRIKRAEAAAKLVEPCATADEFDARLSALCGILDTLQLPESDDGKKLYDLANYLTGILPEESAVRVNRAIEDLRALFALRSWRQHPGADEPGAKAMRQLTLVLPTADWEAAWDQVQLRTVAAIVAIREEIDAFQDDSA